MQIQVEEQLQWRPTSTAVESARTPLPEIDMNSHKFQNLGAHQEYRRNTIPHAPSARAPITLPSIGKYLAAFSAPSYARNSPTTERGIQIAEECPEAQARCSRL